MSASNWSTRLFINTAIVIFVLVSLTFGQDTPSQLSHQKKIYLDKDTNKLFWPKDLPFFVRLSASPDSDAPSYLLNRVSSEENMDGLVVDHGIELELSGKQYIRWYNAVTQDTILLQFYSDGHEPTSNMSFSGSKEFISNNQSFYGPGVECSFDGEDDLSGIEDVYYSVDGKPFQKFDSILTFENEKHYTIQYYAVDKVGNVESVQTSEFSIDSTPPETEHVRIKVYSKNTLSPVTEIYFNGSDNSSGLKDVYYQFDGFDNPMRYPDKHITINHLTDGEHTMYYYGVDQVGNKESPNNYPFYLDNTPPVSRVDIQGDLYSDGSKDYISARSLVILAAEDNKVGLDYIEYAIDGNEFFRYDVPFAVPLLSGSFQLKYRAVDLVSNVSANEIQTFNIDSDPPVCTSTVEGPNHAQAQVIWMTSETKIYLNATDEGSGLQRIEYQIGSEPVQPYNSYIQIGKEGQYSTKSWCIDNVNNRVENNALLLIVDNTPPEILESYSLSPISSKTGTSGTLVNVYPEQLSISLAALDRSSGVSDLTYSINGKDAVRYSQPIMFQKSGTFNILIKTEDKVENSESKELDLIIGE